MMLALVEPAPRYTLLSEHPASDHQAAVFDAVANPHSGSKIIKAVAGAGKTTVIKNALRFLPAGCHVQGVAFNKDAANNLKAALAEITENMGEAHTRNMRMGTFNSIGHIAVARYLGRKDMKIDTGKCRRLLKARLTEDDYSVYGAFASTLCRLAKGEGIGALVPDTEGRWWDLVEHHGLYLDSDEGSPERGIEIARKLLAYSSGVAKRDADLDYDDQLYLVALWKLRLWRNDVVFADESQDVNPIQRAMLHLMLKDGGRLFAVGDEKQCQPTGTMVYATGRGEVPIESLKIGDQLMSYNSGGSNFTGKTTQGRKILDISQRPYIGPMITITAGNKSHDVTPNHRCIVRMAHRRGSCVYLMKKGDHARIGWCRTLYETSYKGGFGLGARARQEGADAAWVLKFFDDTNERDAQYWEMYVAHAYGLPQLTFNYNDLGSADDLRTRLWRELPSNLNRANECLADHGLEPNLPFWEQNSGRHIGLYSFETYAVNLFAEWMTVCVYDGDVHKPDWREISISRREFEGDVWSLSVEPTENGRRLYVANSIVTHNSIYGFRGSDVDAMDTIAREFATQELPLTVSYRCARAVVARAAEVVAYIEPAPGAPQGEVRDDVPAAEALARLTADDAVLCRQTAPLVDLAYKLIAAGRGCRIQGRDIGEGLVNLVQAQKARGIDRLIEKLEAFRDREVAAFLGKGEETKAEAVEDRVACVLTIIGSLPETERTIPALQRSIEGIFRDVGDGVLTLSTVHRAKGLEWDTVAILRPDLMPSKAARQEWQVEQEENLRYVGITRAKRTLLFMDPDERVTVEMLRCT